MGAITKFKKITKWNLSGNFFLHKELPRFRAQSIVYSADWTMKKITNNWLCILCTKTINKNLLKLNFGKTNRDDNIMRYEATVKKFQYCAGRRASSGIIFVSRGDLQNTIDGKLVQTFLYGRLYYWRSEWMEIITYRWRRPWRRQTRRMIQTIIKI